jgi:hypothetical protein
MAIILWKEKENKYYKYLPINTNNSINSNYRNP